MHRTRPHVPVQSLALLVSSNCALDTVPPIPTLQSMNGPEDDIFTQQEKKALAANARMPVNPRFWSNLYVSQLRPKLVSGTFESRKVRRGWGGGERDSRLSMGLGLAARARLLQQLPHALVSCAQLPCDACPPNPMHRAICRCQTRRRPSHPRLRPTGSTRCGRGGMEACLCPCRLGGGWLALMLTPVC